MLIRTQCGHVHKPTVRVKGQVTEITGAQGRDRTTDTAIFSRMLYQLSYLGTSSPQGSWERGFIVRRACPVHHGSPLAMRSAAIWDDDQEQSGRGTTRFRGLPLVSPDFPDPNRCGPA